MTSPRGYIRGGDGRPTDNRRVLQLGLVSCLVAVSLVVLALMVQAVRQDSRSDRLARDGVAVRVTVTGCFGVATGTGITATDFTCQGSFVLDGHPHVDRIAGTTSLLPTGTVFRGVTDPDSPATLSVAGAVTASRGAGRAYVLGAIALVLLLIAGIATVRFRRSGASDGEADGWPTDEVVSRLEDAEPAAQLQR
jgi:hypothetical protein